MVRFNGVDYFYVYNLQGDVAALIDADSTRMVEYVYDAWGYLISKTGSLAATIGTLNPFRYRGYVYDEETGLYYLQNRYYSPNWKRFINVDQSLNEKNLFVYCLGSPIIRRDIDGNESIAVLTMTGGLGIGELAPVIASSVAVIVCGIIDAVSKTNPVFIQQSSAVSRLEEVIYSENHQLVLGLDQAISRALEQETKDHQDWIARHHIVPWDKQNAERGRDVLKKAGIDPTWDSDNLVGITYKLHWFIHNDLYVEGINLVFEGVENYSQWMAPDNKIVLEKNVRATLKILKGLIQSADRYLWSLLR